MFQRLIAPFMLKYKSNYKRRNTSAGSISIY
jgi:hypothetical protein